MGLLDLSLSQNASSKKRLDFNDPRYQLSDKLKQNGKKNVRSTFTLYDNKESNKVAVQDISDAYAVSDKRLPIGELLNKMVDLIIDMEDGVISTEKDAIYTWKYAKALLMMYDDKRKRLERMTAFDNGLKNSIISSQVFANRYPGKYTSRTNFFNQKTKDDFEKDIVDTFQEIALPGIHEAAVQQSKMIAEKHSNTTLDKIVQWAVENYGCTVDSYFEVQEDKETHLFYSTNTIILHLKNGYDMSVIGYSGTDHDDQFAMSIFDARNIAISQHSDRASQSDIQNMLSETSSQEAIDPLKKLLEFEKNKNDVLRKQYEILTAIRPMIPAEVLELKAAESVVGRDYIWGCSQFRKTHEDLPKDFKLSDIKLPSYESETDDILDQRERIADVNSMAASIVDNNIKDHEVASGARTIIKENQGIITGDTSEYQEDEKRGAATSLYGNNTEETSTISGNQPIVKAPIVEQPKSIEEVLAPAIPDALFDEPKVEKPVVKDKTFGDPTRMESGFRMPTLPIGPATTFAPKTEEKKSQIEREFDPAATLLPGFTPLKKEAPKDNAPPVTQQAKPAPKAEPSMWKDDLTSTLLPGITLPKPQSQVEPANESSQFLTPELAHDEEAAKTGDDKSKAPLADATKRSDVSFEDIDSLFM
jgi:hypothetical protein